MSEPAHLPPVEERPKAKHFNRLRVAYRLYRKRFYAALFIISHIAGALTSVDAIMHNRTPQGAVAWSISLNLFPYVAVPAYWVFGNSEFEEYVKNSNETRAKLTPVRKELAEALEREQLKIPSETPFQKTLNRLADLPFTSGNQVDLLINGEETFTSMLAAIHGAEDYILFQSYILRDDTIGKIFQKNLIQKAKAGVRVYVLYDQIGSLGLPDDFSRKLKSAGVKILPFRTDGKEGRKYQLNFRNHRKILVVDGRTGFAGGLNIGDEYINGDAVLSPFRDTHMRVDGPAATMLQIPFMEDWHWLSGDLIGNLNWNPKAIQGGESNVICIPSGPGDAEETCALFFLSAINRATERLWISTPYFVPDVQIMSALRLADLRGVDVRIIIPELNDSRLVKSSSYAYVAKLENTGIKIFRYQKGFTHQKVMLVDDNLSFVGSANFDNRSFRLNFEITLAVDDKRVAAEMEKMLLQDFADSTPTPKDELANKPFWFRLSSRVARLLSPIQ